MTDDPTDPLANRKRQPLDPDSKNSAWFHRMVSPVLGARPPADRWTELRADLMSDDQGTTPPISPRGQATPSSRAPRLVLIAAMVAFIGGAIGIATWSAQDPRIQVRPGSSTMVTEPIPHTSGPMTVPSTTTTTAPVAVSEAPGPSQSPADARRDTIAPDLARLSASERVSVEASITLPEGTWALSRAPWKSGSGGDGSSDDLVLGDQTGTYGRDFVVTPEYGEVILLDATGKIERAYPMAGWPPSWIYATDDAIFGGRIGDGGLSESTIFRIDRHTFILDGIVIASPEPGGEGARAMPGWRDATPEVVAAYRRHELADTQPEAAGTSVTSTIGPMRIDLPAIEELFR